MRHPLAVAALALCALAAAAPPTAPSFCPVQVIADSVTPVVYRPVIRLAPGCPPGGYARVRKSSTLSVKRRGAPYQPIRPLEGAWNVTATGSSIPPRELWTLTTWRWEWYDGARWRGAEVPR